MIGKGVAIAGIQKGLSLAAGFFLMVMAFMMWRFEFLVASIPGFARYTGAVQRMIGKAMGKQGYQTTLSLGVLNGLLPCGLVYGALAGAISTMEAAGGGLFMLLFGAGTLPMLLTVSLLGNKAGNQLRKKLGIVQPLLMIIAGSLLVMRGLHLDLSLFESAVPRAGYECH
jgi:sulfite exporter TauE/SafE